MGVIAKEGWVYSHLTIFALISGIDDSSSTTTQQSHRPMSTWVGVVDRVVLNIAIEVLAEWVSVVTLVAILCQEGADLVIIIPRP